MAAASSGRSPLLPRHAVEFLYHHVFLPPKLPQSDDYDSELDLTLMKVCEESLASFKGLISHLHQEKIQAAISMLASMQKIHSDGTVREKELSNALSDVMEHGAPLSLHVRAQNAGVLVEKAHGNIQFRVFELSPTNQAAMGTIGRLRRSFPAASVSIKLEDFKQPDFQRVVANTLSTMSSDAVPGMQPKARKASQLHEEDRDTTHPGMVTELLVGFLLSVGRPVATSTITKNTREEVRWKDTRSPWRRSPMWLLIRVALQLVLTQADGSWRLYKEVMLVLMGRIEDIALESGLPSDVLYLMNAKIAQRVLKLGNSIDKTVSTHLQQKTKQIHRMISKRWLAVQKQDSRRLDLASLPALDFEADTLVSLPKLDSHIDAMKRQRSSNQASKAIEYHSLMKFPADRLPCMSNPQYFPNETYALANLQGFENWVSSHCSDWRAKRAAVSISKTTEELVTLMKDYHRLAKRYYSGNPERLSVMLLTMFELWVACDEGVTTMIPMLRDYEHGIKHDVLQNLLLRSRHDMDRLHSLEEYLQLRASSTRYSVSKLFFELTTSDSFPVRQFDTNIDQQQTLQRITAAADRARTLKIQEFKDKEREYDALMDRYENSECEYYEVVVNRYNDFRVSRHDRRCDRCRYKRQAQNIEMEVHEWPLPSNATKAKAVVFELRVPDLYAAWREGTLYLITEVLGAKYDNERTPTTKYDLSEDKQLRSYLQCRNSSYRCGLASDVKSHTVTHRNTKKIATASEGDVCLQNGSNYKYFDSSKKCFMSSFNYSVESIKAYTYRLPARSSVLQKYLYRPSSAKDGPPPNSVVANQAECPDHMTLEEFKELASIPLGHRLQWYNILLQFWTPTIDMKKEEAALVIFQCIHQAGPIGETNRTLRSAHTVLKDDKFATELLDSLVVALRRVKENWESLITLSVFATVIGRLLSLTKSETIQQRCTQALKDIRDVAFGWVVDLRERAQNADSYDIRDQLCTKSVDAALVCGLTLDVDDSFLTDMLSSAKNVSILVQCSIVVQEAKKVYSRSGEPVLSLLYSRFRNLLRRTCDRLCAGPAGLEEAVQKAWPAYRPTQEWTALKGHEDHLIQTKTSTLDQQHTLAVQYNVLTGELLVDGFPLDRPPREYEDHHRWSVLFGRSAIEVMPTTVPGMQFSIKQKYRDFEVHVGIDRGSGSNDLVVHGRKGEDTYTTVPARLFEGEFPEFFVQKFVHWYNHRNGTIEFRLAENPWEQSSATMWTLRRLSQRKWQLANKDSGTAIKLKSPTSAALASILSPLAEASRIHINLTTARRSITIDIPTLQIGFSMGLGESSLVSREFRDMCIDEDQSLQTLHGFTGKLLLKPRQLGQRMVLLTEGPISVNSTGEHVRVSVNKNCISKVHPLHVDELLGRLVDNGNLQCKLFQAHIHGLTSFCLSDLLTGNTGTEQCIAILKSAAVRSFDQLSSENVETLKVLASLTPRRCYYPPNEHVMQTVNFSSNTGFLSQHNGVAKAVAEIFGQAKESNAFYAESIDLPDPLNDVDPNLLERDEIRSSTFRTFGYGAEDFTSSSDKRYRARDSDQRSNRTINAHILSTIVCRNQQAKHWELQRDQLWAEAKGAGTVYDSTIELTPSTFKFHSKLVGSGLSFYQWLPLHRNLRPSSSGGPSKFDVMIWLATMAASKQVNLSTLQTIALLYTTPNLQVVSIPGVETCSPAQGYKIQRSDVESIALSNAFDIDRSPEANLQAKDGEDWMSFETRQDRLFKSHRSRSIEQLSDYVFSQWPARQISIPDFSSEEVRPKDYINMSAFSASANRNFSLCFDNLQLVKYFARIEDVISSLPTQVVAMNTPTVRLLPTHSPCKRTIAASDIFDQQAPVLPPKTESLTKSLYHQAPGTPPQRLSNLVALLESSCSSPFESEYVQELRTSVESLQRGTDLHAVDLDTTVSQESLLIYRTSCVEHLKVTYNKILSHIHGIAERVPGGMICFLVAQWPRISPMALLHRLSRQCWATLRSDQKECIVQYGLAIAEVQRADRLLKAASSPNKEDLITEIINPGHVNWSPLRFPESLLLEIESRITIRDVQEEIAAEMRSPSNSQNSVMQLNMGEGKSSVIVPMVAAALADSSQLVRVVVAKPQSKQMLQMLTSTLGGLIDRRVRQMPFSRSLKLSSASAKAVDRFLRDCMSRGDILLVQPEHILSFRLMVLECSISEHREAVGHALLASQNFFDQHSRDIVDESDENFSTKFELIYTMGSQRQIEFSPNRWRCIQQVLELVRTIGPDIKSQIPDAVELHHSLEGGFPRFRILKPEAADLLVSLIADQICDTGIEGLPIARQPVSVRRAVRRYLVELELSEDAIQSVERLDAGSLWQSASAKSYLLLLRGLLAGGILAFAFGQKRWRVNYGLVSSRIPATQLAVPYRAKDNPTPRSEFSHPDVVLVLTCLSYYYDGLENDHLFTALEQLMRSDQADVDYETWINDSPNIPSHFRQLEGVNIKDRLQCISDVFPHLKHSKAVIDYYLATVVFPKQVKEFPDKLSASGWDIGTAKAFPTTGFSGTNDSKKLLPLDVQHLDLTRQQHTNALVLNHILDPRNSVHLLNVSTAVDMSDAEHLIATVVQQDPPVQAILDVGAQILELNNQGVAQRWLELHQEHYKQGPDQKQAVIFVNDVDELSVLDRKGRIELLQTSSYSSRLDECLIFLDEAHTRGIDLKLPKHYRAAVTLGANLTKDRLAQGMSKQLRFQNMTC